MEFDFQGRHYLYDPARMDVRTAMAIKLHTGFGLLSWQNAVMDMDPAAVQALLFAVKAQNGEPCDIATLEFPILEFIEVFSQARLAEVQAAMARRASGQEAGSDPKGGSGRPPRARTRKPTPT